MIPETTTERPGFVIGDKIQLIFSKSGFGMHVMIIGPDIAGRLDFFGSYAVLIYPVNAREGLPADQ